MDFVTVEIDIQPDGSIKAVPNPVGAASGDVLRIHIRSNQSDKEKVKVTFKGGAKSPFGNRDSSTDGDASPCNGPTHGVEWPEGATEGRVIVEVHGSPVVATAEIIVHRIVARQLSAGAGPCVVNNYYFCDCCKGR
ncbi:MAG: hypothetical protein ABSD59_05030 [Terracidiphilus sp.]|jgi:hypothetical protein